MDLGVCDADWVSVSDELHLSVVHCGSCSFTQSGTIFSRLTLRLQLSCESV